MTKEEAIKRLETIVAHSTKEYNYIVYPSGWGKRDENGEVTASRTYFKVIETRDNSKHHVEYPFGYINDFTGEYVAGKNDLTRNYDLSGAKFDENTEVRERTPEQKKKDSEYYIHHNIATEMLNHYADKIAAEMGYEGKISENLCFLLTHVLYDEVFEDKIIRDRVTEIIKNDILDFRENFENTKE